MSCKYIGNIYLWFIIINLSYCNVIWGPVETVKGGEYVYYNMTSLNSYVYLQLSSLSGDCDLYISQSIEYPTYDNYTHQSVTCGLDTAILLTREKGPVHIGVYGHPSYDISECILSVCVLDHPIRQDEFIDELTEMSDLTESVHDMCHRNVPKEQSYFRRTLDVLAQIITSIELDSFFFEFISALAQAVI